MSEEEKPKEVKVTEAIRLTDVAESDGGEIISCKLSKEQDKAVRKLYGSMWIECAMCGSLSGVDSNRREVVMDATSIKYGMIHLTAVCGKCFDDFKRTWRLLAKRNKEASK